ncbi:glycosyltransferase [Enterovibrio norvegicus]|uniref:Glycosyltransferase n=1 Tax=Enterovibrio norvegicus TaxID=188144 RepID=A0ABV4KWB2_9GAMM|nr:glycosyltransferase [Enterovibrio norvegicus]OEF58803.1 hypothetical protein A1OU_11650 [Enterovibrio norvegicus]
MEKLSVVMCVYNGDSDIFLKDALVSVISQTYRESEFILVQDGPINDELLEVIIDFKGEINGFKHIILEENRGHGAARNVGLSNCSNDIVAIMDADDINHPTRFEKQIERISNSDLSVVGSSLAEFTSDIYNITSFKTLPSDHDEIISLAKWKCPINQPSVMFRKSNVDDVGGYLDWYHNEDYYLWLRMLNAGYKFYNISEPLVYFRLSQGTIARRGGVKYFLSEAKIQKLIYDMGIGNIFSFVFSVAIRFVVQVLAPNSIRTILYKLILRKSKI